MAVAPSKAPGQRGSESAVLRVSIPAGGRAIACWRTPHNAHLHEVTAAGAEIASVWLEGQPVHLTGLAANMEAYDCVEVRLINPGSEDTLASVVLRFDAR